MNRKIRDAQISISDIILNPSNYQTAKDLYKHLYKGSFSERQKAVNDAKNFGNVKLIDEGVSLVKPEYLKLVRKLDGLLPRLSKAQVLNRFINRKGFVGDVFNNIYIRFRDQRLFYLTIDELRQNMPKDEVIEVEIASAIIVMFGDTILKDFDKNVASFNSLDKIESRLKEKVPWFEEPTEKDREMAKSLLNKCKRASDYYRHSFSNLKRIKEPSKKKSRAAAFAIYSVYYMNEFGMLSNPYLYRYIDNDLD